MGLSSVVGIRSRWVDTIWTLSGGSATSTATTSSTSSRAIPPRRSRGQRGPRSLEKNQQKTGQTSKKLFDRKPKREYKRPRSDCTCSIISWPLVSLSKKQRGGLRGQLRLRDHLHLQVGWIRPHRPSGRELKSLHDSVSSPLHTTAVCSDRSFASIPFERRLKIICRHGDNE